MPLPFPIGKKHIEVQCFNCRIEPARLGCSESALKGAGLRLEAPPRLGWSSKSLVAKLKQSQGKSADNPD